MAENRCIRWIWASVGPFLLITLLLHSGVSRAELDGLCGAGVEQGNTECSSDALDTQSFLQAGERNSTNPQLALLFILHEAGMPNDYVWREWLELPQHKEDIVVYCHLKDGVALDDSLPGADFIREHLLETRRPALWGHVTLLDAIVSSLEEIVTKGSPDVGAITVISGHHIPLRSIYTNQSYLTGLEGPGKVSRLSEICTFDEAGWLEREQAQNLLLDMGEPEEHAQLFADSLWMHHTWMVLSRAHAEFIVGMKDAALYLGEHLFDRLQEAYPNEEVLAADEFMVGTLLRYYGYGHEVEDEPTTDAMFQQYNATHPLLWTHMEEEQVFYDPREEANETRTLQAVVTRGHKSGMTFTRKIDVRDPEQRQLLLQELRSLWSAPVDFYPRPHLDPSEALPCPLAGKRVAAEQTQEGATEPYNWGTVQGWWTDPKTGRMDMKFMSIVWDWAEEEAAKARAARDELRAAAAAAAAAQADEVTGDKEEEQPGSREEPQSEIEDEGQLLQQQQEGGEGEEEGREGTAVEDEEAEGGKVQEEEKEITPELDFAHKEWVEIWARWAEVLEAEAAAAVQVTGADDAAAAVQVSNSDGAAAAA